MKKFIIIFTLDYEIHGNGEGAPEHLMIRPTERILDLFDEYGAKLTIMADIGEILRFKSYFSEHGQDVFFYNNISKQLKNAVKNGHDVQLHIHSSYFNSKYENGRWQQDWSEYSLSKLNYDRLYEMIKTGKNYLEELLTPVKPDYRCFAFRAANWSMHPSSSIVRALLENGIKIDTSVFKYGKRQGIVTFDYSSAFSDLIPWPVDENDVCKMDADGTLYEFPIYCENRHI